MKQRLTEAVLWRRLAEHMRDCVACDYPKKCETAERIEAAFWDEVDWRIDEREVRA